MSSIVVATRFEDPRTAKEISIMCPHCNGSVFLPVPANDHAERQRRVRAAIDEHRRLCTAAPPEAKRVYEIAYPRR